MFTKEEKAALGHALSKEVVSLRRQQAKARFPEFVETYKRHEQFIAALMMKVHMLEDEDGKGKGSDHKGR